MTKKKAPAKPTVRSIIKSEDGIGVGVVKFEPLPPGFVMSEDRRRSLSNPISSDGETLRIKGCTVVRETEKAILVEWGGAQQKWCAKSILKNGSVRKLGQRGTLVAPEWIMRGPGDDDRDCVENYDDSGQYDGGD